MTHYMAELILTGRPVLMIGGGKVARRKLAGLLECGARVRVIAPELDPWIAERVPAMITHQAEVFDPAHLQDGALPVLVFAATGDARLNREIAFLCQERGLLCNSADDPGVSGFLVAAVVRRGALVIGVGSGGLSPALSRLLKERLDRWLEVGWGGLVRLFGGERDLVRGTLRDPEARQRFWRETALAAERERRYEQADNTAWFRARLERVDGKP
ncbi:MAG: bifunctional precorrin-2 dehydrogenase/sirohydrochlorin ferrochelatase [Magnetococcales bacterium]|nr:bifunctional precorrin-2 dehydrogenase/sirohydrochlorin ferrochelatase [Magnetococcales bacterium]